MLFDIGENIDLIDGTLFELFVFLKSADFNNFNGILFRVELVGGSEDFSVSSFSDDFVECVVFDDSNHFDN
jgi:hypothetical protein